MTHSSRGDGWHLPCWAIPHTSGQSLLSQSRISRQHSQLSNSITRLSHTTNAQSPSKAARNVAEELRPQKAAKSRGTTIKYHLKSFWSCTKVDTPQTGRTFVNLTFGHKRIQIQLVVINCAIQSWSEQPVTLNSPDSWLWLPSMSRNMLPLAEAGGGWETAAVIPNNLGAHLFIFCTKKETVHK